MIDDRPLTAARAAILCCFLATQTASAIDIEAGPIWNNEDAKVKCPDVCAAAGRRWNGGWHTTVWTRMSVCNCDGADPLSDAVSMRRGGAGATSRPLAKMRALCFREVG